MRKFLILIAAALFLYGGAPAFASNATNGNPCNVSGDNITLLQRGTWRVVKCINICNAYAATDSGTNCNRTGTSFSYEIVSYADVFVFERDENDGNCSGDVTFTVTASVKAAGDFSQAVGEIDDADQTFAVAMATSPLFPFIKVAVANDTGCTDVDLRMFFVIKR